jgi:hypothetical protein
VVDSKDIGDQVTDETAKKFVEKSRASLVILMEVKNR